MKNQTLTLCELNGIIGETLELSFPSSFWVIAEISSIHFANNGHCYIELVERDSKQGLTAKASAHIWADRALLLVPYFEKTTGTRLSSGIKIMAEVNIDFHALYGYSLNITDLDATYTMGDLARNRQEILSQLRNDGILNLNKELVLNRPLSKIAIISSSTAAGYGDFMAQLSASSFAFKTQLFSATMQGSNTEESIIRALDKVHADRNNWDVVVIIRGGGAVSDLTAFDSYLLASHVAQFPLPVLTGIGHERDNCILDEVAHIHFKTPTAVAAYLIEVMSKEWDYLSSLSSELEKYTINYLNNYRNKYTTLAQRFMFALAGSTTSKRQILYSFQHRIASAIEKKIQKSFNEVSELREKLITGSQNKIEKEKLLLLHHERMIKLHSPDHILKLGYSITKKNGTIITDSSQLSVGDHITTTFINGSIDSCILHHEKRD